MKTEQEQWLKEHTKELSSFLKTLPQDDIDWALVIYLLRHHHRSMVWAMEINPSCVITANKMAKFFNLEPDDVTTRLSRMCILIHKFNLIGFYKNSVTIYRLKEDVFENLIFPMLAPFGDAYVE